MTPKIAELPASVADDANAGALVPASERSFVLWNVSWKTYESLMEDYASRSAPHFTYDRGTLLIVSPLKHHEQANRTLHDMVNVLIEEWDMNAISLGSTTFKRADIERGFEPDTCFYLREGDRIAALPEMNLEDGDPPPDLVIEIDLTSPSLNKMPVLASFGVPEVWRWSRGNVRFFALADGEYAERAESVGLAPLTGETVNGFLAQRTGTRARAWAATIRQWARQNPHQP